MEAIDFIKTYHRLCDQYIDKDCEGCPFTPMECSVDNLDVAPEKLVKVTEEWAKEHLVKTRMEDFFEKYPNAPKEKSGAPECCVANLGFSVPSYCSCEVGEEDCCKKCWNRPLEE